MKYYVYKLIDPRDKNTIYVGKGTGRRSKEHVNLTKRNKISNKNTKLFNKLRSILDEGFDDVLYEYEYFSAENEAFYREIELIDSIGLDNLCNLTRGGNGGDRLSNHPRKKEIYANRKNIPWNKGRPATEEDIEKNRLARLKWFEQHPDGKNNSGTFKSGTEHSQFGKKQSTERIEKRRRVMLERGHYDGLADKMRNDPHLPDNSIPIEQTDLDGNVIATFKSASEAARILNIPRSRIANILYGKSKRTGEWRFRYIS
jgi:hypothetical protein